MMPSEDIVFIRGLKVDTIIGIFDWERQVEQTLFIDLTLHTSICAAAKSDDIRDALDYKALSKRITEYVKAHHFHLVERLIERLAAVVLDEFAVTTVTVSVNKKGALRQAEDVGITITRRKGNDT